MESLQWTGRTVWTPSACAKNGTGSMPTRGVTASRKPAVRATPLRSPACSNLPVEELRPSPSRFGGGRFVFRRGSAGQQSLGEIQPVLQLSDPGLQIVHSRVFLHDHLRVSPPRPIVPTATESGNQDRHDHDPDPWRHGVPLSHLI